MKPGGPLKRTKELRRAAGMRAAVKARRKQPPRKDFAAAVTMVLALEATCAQAARICGLDDDAVPSVRDAAARRFRENVMARDGGMCQAQAAQDCDGRAADVQHRVAHGQGGTSDPAIAFGMANGIGLCRPCHRLCEDRDGRMYERGFWRHRGEDPALVPVTVATPAGLADMWLLADGTRTFERPEAVNAA